LALYIPAGQRRRRAIAVAVATLLLGLIVGLLTGRALAPSVGDRVREVQGAARETAAGLRVIALHDQAGALANQTSGDGGADLVLKRTRSELEHEFGLAPWLGRSQRDELLRAMDALQAIPDRTGPAFGSAAEALAAKIEATFAVPS
jgi:hypothetical protein